MKRKLPIGLLVLPLAAAGLAAGWYFRPFGRVNKTVASPVLTSAPDPGLLKKTLINRWFTFPMRDNSGSEVTQISYGVDSAELRNEIILNGQTATAAPGRVFLIFNIRLRNDSSQPVQLATGDYVRLNTNNGQDWLAPEINNDPVIVQAISTKLTRLGFPINQTATDFKLQVGEIKGDKTTFEVNF